MSGSMGENLLGSTMRLLQGLSHLVGAQEGDSSQRRQRLVRMDLVEHEREHLYAEPSPNSGRQLRGSSVSASTPPSQVT